MSDDKNTLLVRDGDCRASDLRSLDRLFAGVFGESPFFGRRTTEAGFGWAPAVDIRETDAELIVYAAVPGLNKEDVSLEVKDNTLILTGRMKPLGSDEDTWVRRELPRGEFYRAFHLSADVQVGKVKASMHNGVLEIRLPKAEEARPRKIEINAA
jgi:HSP20 family protein